MPTRKEVIDANIKLHSQLSGVYKKIEPHYRPENAARVEKIIKDIATLNKAESLLDVGCGMGFIIDIAKKYFKKIRGIDVTPDMIEKVNSESSTCDIKVQINEVENLDFESNSFDVCTAYAVLHHLHDLKPAFQEIYRVLKPGGVFYSDTDPNYYFWEAFSKLPDTNTFSDIINREIYAVNHKDDELEEQCNIEKEVLNTAEVLKHINGGFKEGELRKLIKEIGFSDLEIRYEWFLGEWKIINSPEAIVKNAAGVIRNHLQEMLPLSRHVFKYLCIIAKK